MQRARVLILGAAGRDFHNFNVRYRDDESVEVVGFTATQIPNIVDRRYPPDLSGPLYPDGIKIYAEAELEALISDLAVDRVVMSYSDISHEHVMHLASRVLAAGADYSLLGMKSTALKSKKPMIAVCAVRTGCGKSQTSRYITRLLKEAGKRVVAIRHPMPYGDLTAQRVQRFAVMEDLVKHNCTIEEREEYEAYVKQNAVIYAGVDYQAILDEAEKEADVIIWDGGNNDLPFYQPDLWVTVADPHRAGHELTYHPGETNLRAADILVINKVDTASLDQIEQVEANLAMANPSGIGIRCDSAVSVDDESAIRGKRVLLVEDGPTLTHGEMSYGAGKVAADKFGAAEIIDPRPYAVGSILEVYEKFPHLTNLVPAMGYYDAQIAELEQTINQSDCEVVVIGTPIDLGAVLKIDKPSVRVRYTLVEPADAPLAQAVRKLVADA